MIVTFSADAQADLNDISRWIANDSPRRATSFGRELRRSCSELRHRPERFTVVELSADRRLRRRVHGAYVIYFAILSDEVRILRILHGARDHEALLADDG